MEIPLFPLRTVLYPQGPLPLRVFEPRYLDMISRCMKEEIAFGVLLIRQGAEMGPATTYTIGTTARICDWYQGSDGLLGVTAYGVDKFTLQSQRCQSDGLNIGTVELLAAEVTQTLPAEYQPLAHILESVLDDLGRLYEDLEKHYDDATWVGCRFAEILPISLEEKQFCLETEDPFERLNMIRDVLNNVREEETA